MNKKAESVPTILIVLGATGDLMAKKIAPALYQLYKGGHLPKLFTIYGFARREMSHDEFRHLVKRELVQKGIREVDDSFLNLCYYHTGNFEHKVDYLALAKTLGHVDAEWQACSNKLFYLAVPPIYYASIFKKLADSKLSEPCSDKTGWTRIIVEKPFGKDLKTAQELDAMLGKLFKEEQIYRIDHYLAKEMLQNILVFRFNNNLLEGMWDNKHVESIEMKLYETLGVEHRGSFYDGVGTLKDVGQNHLLQMVALSLMDRPKSFSSPHVRAKRTELLQSLPHLTMAAIKKNTVRAQYTGYQTIAGVQKNSQTETYFKMQFSLNHPRWKGVPITIESGKRLPEARKEVVITFKHPKKCSCPTDGPHYKNTITFRMEPKEEIIINFWAKKPGLTMDVREADFQFTYSDSAGVKQQYTHEYERLLLDCILGNQLLFLSTDEVAAMWKFIDPISAAWEANAVPLHTYTPDTYPSL